MQIYYVPTNTIWSINLNKHLRYFHTNSYNIKGYFINVLDVKTSESGELVGSIQTQTKTSFGI